MTDHRGAPEDPDTPTGDAPGPDLDDDPMPCVLGWRPMIQFGASAVVIAIAIVLAFAVATGVLHILLAPGVPRPTGTEQAPACPADDPASPYCSDAYGHPIPRPAR